MKIKETFLIILLFPILTISQEQSFDIFHRWAEFTDLDNALYHHYAAEAFKLLDKREKEISKLKTKTDWEKRQEKVKKILQKIVGPFPEKTPLNAQVTGIIQKKNYRVEKIIFESHPEFYVTAAIFIPNKLKGKTAAILFPIGHTGIAFRSKHYQKTIINLVNKGFVVLTWDPIGQGERLGYFNQDIGKSIIGGSTMEHSYPGMQCLLSGSSFARYEIWDGIRAVDYLYNRPEVDTNRIGITGISGGATQSAYIAVFDDRIYATAPECWVTSYRRLFQSWAPQDAEQNLFYELLYGIDHADFLEVLAPKPVLQITTTWDFFSIQGAKETEQEVKKIYKLFGAQNNFHRTEDDAKHSITKKNSETKFAFFQKFLNLPGDSIYYDVDYLTEKELQVTETGQISTSFGGETVFSLNKKETVNLLNKIKEDRTNIESHLQNVVRTAKKLSGYRKPVNIDNIIFSGRYQRNGYAIEKYSIDGEDGDYPIPFLLFVPKIKKGTPIMYLDDEGKKIHANIGGEIEMLVKQGYPVLVPDLVGFGELYPSFNGWEKINSNLGYDPGKLWYSPLLIGRSIVGIQSGDIERLVIYLKQYSGLKADKIIGIAKGNCTTSLLHAEAFEKSFSQIILINPLISYESIVMNKYYYADAVPPFVYGALKSYDLPDLAATVAPQKLLMIDIKNQLKKNATDKQIKKEYDFTKQIYSKIRVENNFSIKKSDTNENYTAIILKELSGK